MSKLYSYWQFSNLSANIAHFKRRNLYLTTSNTKASVGTSFTKCEIIAGIACQHIDLKLIIFRQNLRDICAFSLSIPTLVMLLISKSYNMGCPPVRGDKPRALACQHIDLRLIIFRQNLRDICAFS